MTPKDNDELRRELKDRIDRYFDCYLAEDGVLINDIMHLISTHTLRALERARMWEQYAGDYEKRYYDIKLWSGEVYENCWPNANTFHEGVIGKLIEGKDVAYVRPSQTPQLNHQKSQKEGE